MNFNKNSLLKASGAVVILIFITTMAFAQADKQLTHDIFKELIEINTTNSKGNCTAAVEAMAARLRKAGFPDKDLFIGGPQPKKRKPGSHPAWHRQAEAPFVAGTYRCGGSAERRLDYRSFSSLKRSMDIIMPAAPAMTKLWQPFSLLTSFA